MTAAQEAACAATAGIESGEGSAGGAAECCCGNVGDRREASAICWETLGGRPEYTEVPTANPYVRRCVSFDGETGAALGSEGGFGEGARG